MATYLSPEWLQDFDDAVRADVALNEACSGVQLVIQYEIADDTAPTVTYAVRFEADGARVVSGDAGDADVVFVADRPTAAAIAQGRASAQRAVIDGRLTLDGSTTALLGRSDLLGKLGSVLESLRADTTWD